MSWSRLNFVSCLYITTNEGLGFLKLADIVLILISPSPCYVKSIQVLGMNGLENNFMPDNFWKKSCQAWNYFQGHSAIDTIY